MDVLGRVFRRLNGLAEVCVREADADPGIVETI